MNNSYPAQNEISEYIIDFEVFSTWTNELNDILSPISIFLKEDEGQFLNLNLLEELISQHENEKNSSQISENFVKDFRNQNEQNESNFLGAQYYFGQPSQRNQNGLSYEQWIPQQESIIVDQEQLNDQVQHPSVVLGGEEQDFNRKPQENIPLANQLDNQVQRPAEFANPQLQAIPHSYNHTSSRTSMELIIVRIYFMIVGQTPFHNLGQKIPTWLKYITRQLKVQQKFPSLKGVKWLNIQQFAKLIKNSEIPDEVFQIGLFDLEQIDKFFSRKLDYAKYLNKQPLNSPTYNFVKFIVRTCNKIVFKCVKRKVRDICQNRKQVNSFRDMDTNKDFRKFQKLCQNRYSRIWRHFLARLKTFEKTKKEQKQEATLLRVMIEQN